MTAMYTACACASTVALWFPFVTIDIPAAVNAFTGGSWWLDNGFSAKQTKQNKQRELSPAVMAQLHLLCSSATPQMPSWWCCVNMGAIIRIIGLFVWSSEPRPSLSASPLGSAVKTVKSVQKRKKKGRRQQAGPLATFSFSVVFGLTSKCGVPGVSAGLSQLKKSRGGGLRALLHNYLECITISDRTDGES